MSCMQLEEVRGEADGIRSELAQLKVHYYNNYIDDHDQYTCTYSVISIGYITRWRSLRDLHTEGRRPEAV